MNIIWPKTLILKIKRMRARKNKVEKAGFPDSDIICTLHDTKFIEN